MILEDWHDFPTCGLGYSCHVCSQFWQPMGLDSLGQHPKVTAIPEAWCFLLKTIISLTIPCKRFYQQLCRAKRGGSWFFTVIVCLIPQTCAQISTHSASLKHFSQLATVSLSCSFLNLHRSKSEWSIETHNLSSLSQFTLYYLQTPSFLLEALSRTSDFHARKLLWQFLKNLLIMYRLLWQKGTVYITTEIYIYSQAYHRYDQGYHRQQISKKKIKA